MSSHLNIGHDIIKEKKNFFYTLFFQNVYVTLRYLYGTSPARNMKVLPVTSLAMVASVISA